LEQLDKDYVMVMSRMKLEEISKRNLKKERPTLEDLLISKAIPKVTKGKSRRHMKHI
jgi:hypothetical protein